MRYIADSNDYLTEVSFGAVIECGGVTCIEYTGSVPSGYATLYAWYLANAEKLCQWKIVNGNLTKDTGVSPAAEVIQADFVIEQGTSGIWAYRKWASGIAECWGTQTDTNVSVNTAWGNVYESARSGGVAYPTGLFTANPVCTMNVQSSPRGAIMSLEVPGSSTATNTPYWAYTRPTANTGLTVTVGMHAIGRWK